MSMSIGVCLNFPGPPARRAACPYHGGCRMLAEHGRKPAGSNRKRRHQAPARVYKTRQRYRRAQTPSIALGLVSSAMARLVSSLLPVLLYVAAAVFAAAASVTVAGANPRLFRANDTLLGARVACSDAEKLCLRYNRLLHPDSGKCFRVGSPGPCLDSAFLLDRDEFEARRRLVGVCADPGRCPDHRFRMAYDGRCYTSKEVFGVFCDVRSGTFGWPYFFGGYECVCEGAGCPAARYVKQPAQPGECRLPNFRKDLSSSFFPRLPKNDLECSLAQSRCFANGQVSFGADGKCYELLQRGPCPPGEHLLLDKQEAVHNRNITTLCVPIERCLPGFRFMTQRHMCVNETKVENVMCPELNAFTDVFGETVCRFKEEFYTIELKSPQEGLCNLRYNVQLAGLQEEPKPKCTDPLECLQFDEVDPDTLMSSLGEI